MSRFAHPLRCPADRRVETTISLSNLGHMAHHRVERDKTPPSSCWWGSPFPARRTT